MTRLLSIMLLLAAFSSDAATYFVDCTNGSNLGAGTIVSPWQTVSYGTRTRGAYLQPGDTLYLRGGLYLGNTNAIDLGTGIGVGGTTNAPIRIMGYPGERPIISWVTGFSAVIIKNRQSWHFENITYATNHASFSLVSVTNFTFTNCTFSWMFPNIQGPTNHLYANVGVTGDSQGNRWLNCTFNDWGAIYTNGPPSTNPYSYIISGVPISFGEETTDPKCWYNLVEGCQLYHGGHDLFQLNTAYTVIRSNVFHNEGWIETNDVTGTQLYNYANPRTEPNYYGKWGARGTKPGDAGTSQIDMRNVFDGNTFLYASPPPDSGGAFGIELGTRDSIYRNNVIAYSVAAGVYFNNSGSTTCSSNNAFYNNVVFGNGLSRVYGGVNMTNISCGLNMNTYLDRRTNNWLVNNIVWGNYPYNIHTNLYTSFHMRTNWSGDIPALGYPEFTSTNGFGFTYDAESLPDFHLTTNSPCIDAGAFLAFASSDGSGTALPVDNSIYFSDGNRIVTGDTIQLQGATNLSIILSNDTAGNVLHLSEPLIWTAGQGVSLPYLGAAPDMGIAEVDAQSGEDPPDTPPVLLVTAPSNLSSNVSGQIVFEVAVAGTITNLVGYTNDVPAWTNDAPPWGATLVFAAGTNTVYAFGENATTNAWSTTNTFTVYAAPVPEPDPISNTGRGVRRRWVPRQRRRPARKPSGGTRGLSGLREPAKREACEPQEHGRRASVRDARRVRRLRAGHGQSSLESVEHNIVQEWAHGRLDDAREANLGHRPCGHERVLIPVPRDVSPDVAGDVENLVSDLYSAPRHEQVLDGPVLLVIGVAAHCKAQVVGLTRFGGNVLVDAARAVTLHVDAIGTLRAGIGEHLVVPIDPHVEDVRATYVRIHTQDRRSPPLESSVLDEVCACARACQREPNSDNHFVHSLGPVRALRGYLHSTPYGSAVHYKSEARK